MNAGHRNGSSRSSIIGFVTNVRSIGSTTYAWLSTSVILRASSRSSQSALTAVHASCSPTNTFNGKRVVVSCEG